MSDEPVLTGAEAEVVQRRADQLFTERWDANVCRVDRLFAWILAGQWLFAIVVALTLSPYSWEGKTRSIHIHVPVAVVLGAAISAFPLFLIWRRPGAPITRYSVAIAQMLWSALLIHLTGGRIETHFHVFGSLALLAFYRDWRVLVPATAVVCADHLIRQVYWPESVYGVSSPESWRFIEHGFWVVFEESFLLASCVVGQREMKKLAQQNAWIESSQQLQSELAIATRIQTALLPQARGARRLSIAAKMIPAAEVGGDYYDVIPTDDGCWLAIGDVAGHGLEAGLVMLQVQSAVKALASQKDAGSPAVVLQEVNHVLYDNLNRSSSRRLHMTLSLLRYHDNGRIEMAGAHEDVIVYRASTRRCEVFQTRGTWIALVEDIRDVTELVRLHLDDGDVLVLYTDGVTEAGADTGDCFGLDRMCATIEALEVVTADRVREAVLDAVNRWTRTPHDDVTIIAAERLANDASSIAA